MLIGDLFVVIITEYICINCNLDCKKANVAGFYCSNKCQQEYKRNKRIEDWLNGKVVAKRTLIRYWLTKIFGYKCNKCGISDWKEKPITLWVDHIDGNARNNHHTNFQLICPNCDSQQPTFGGKNYGKGRKSLGLPQYG